MSSETSLSRYWQNIDHYLALPRMESLLLSPDGRTLVATVSLINAEGTKYTSQLFALDPAGKLPARQLTHQAEGATGPVFLANGDLLFRSARSGQERRGEIDETKQSRIYRLSAGKDGQLAAEAVEVYTRSGALTGLLAASKADTLVAEANFFPAAQDDEEDAKYHQLRKDAKVDAILHTSYPVRDWDTDLGPQTPRYGLLNAVDDEATDAQSQAESAESDEPLSYHFTGQRSNQVANLQLSLVPPFAGQLDTSSPQRRVVPGAAVLSPDGQTLAYAVTEDMGSFDFRIVVRLVNLSTGSDELLEAATMVPADIDPSPAEDAAELPLEYYPVVFSPCGRYLAVNISRVTTPECCPWGVVGIYDLHTKAMYFPCPQAPLWFYPVDFTEDGSKLLASADEQGRHRLYLIDVASGEYQRLGDDDDSFVEPQLGTDAVYALHTRVGLTPAAVRIDLHTGQLTPLENPAAVRPELPGTVTEVHTEAADGQALRAWLVLPEGADAENPAPLLTFIHGGPVHSWNNVWSWRWNPYLMTAHGYAVLLPDPALSTGYGRAFIQRGRGRWGAEPYTDLLALVDAAEARADIDASRSAALGGSFGGYMANWVAGHTDRFRAIVTHASLWALDQFGPTTDYPYFWQREYAHYDQLLAHSPHQSVAEIKTPMLVIHGDKDYRVPIGEGLRLWWELNTRSQLPAEQGQSRHQFLYFPQENHWILSPQHSKVWYQVILAFLAEHVHGQQLKLPPVLGLN